MNFLRFFLFPLAIPYSIITGLRNVFFDWGIFTSKKYKNPTIGVGNLSAGGTGKSVCVDYIVSLLEEEYPMAVLSRGYGRKTKGYVEASESSTFRDIGDEPKMLKRRHPNAVVAVAESRRLGMKNLLEIVKPKTVFVWDDCYQHRWVSPDLMILLTPYHKLFVDDYHLPVGNLRELSVGKKRADVVIVTKCPSRLSVHEKNKISQKLQLAETQNLFFAKIGYSELIRNDERTFPIDRIENIPFVLVTGIADPRPLVYFLKSVGAQFDHIKFPDHHVFTKKDVKRMEDLANGRMILTTEKDYVRLASVIKSELLFYLDIEMQMSKSDQMQLDQILWNASSKEED